ncbi:MAG: DEAD/DEAH box helicase family protein [Nitrososphaerota archaeon]|nr:DEAD/DEAH box helicase family protein [Nitrososphaerota archaeon]
MTTISLEGRVMRRKGDPRSRYVVVTTAVGNRASETSIHVARISASPMAFERIPLEELEEETPGAPLGGWEAVAHLVARSLSGSSTSEGAAFASNTEFKPYQFRPLLKFLASDSKRILIADEAGLGKTVEAGYIIVEDISRYVAKRILVLCPAGLRQKWRDDMWSRFGMVFDVVQGAELFRRLRGPSPFRLIASFDSARRPREEGPPVESEAIDLLVIDEVHHMIGRTGEVLRRKLGLATSRASKHTVALSATPVQLELDDLRRVLEVVLGTPLEQREFTAKIDLVRLLNQIRFAVGAGGHGGDLDSLLSSLAAQGVQEAQVKRLRALSATPGGEEFERELKNLDPFKSIVTRSRRRDVGEFRARDIQDCWIDLDGSVGRGRSDDLREASEFSVFKRIDELLSSSFTYVHRRQLASSLPATIGLLRGGASGFRVWVRDGEGFNELERRDEEDGGVPAPLPYRALLSPEERARCRSLVDLYDRLAKDSKWEFLRELISSLEDEKPRKIIVFTQWVPTLEYMREKAQTIPGVGAFAISGESPEYARERILSKFKGFEGPAVLFATDFLSEGVDLQYADTIINYDLPTNPQRVEQRIGRIDRVGQASEKIVVRNLWTRDTIDEDVEAVNKRRIQLFREGIGDVTAITGDTAADYRKEPDEEVERRRLAQLTELNSTGIFSGVEGFIDSQAFELRSRQVGSMHRLWWLPVANMLIRASGFIASMVDEGGTVLVGPLDTLALEVVGRWTGVQNGDIVESQLMGHMDDNGRVRLSKSPGGPGLFCAPANPLVEVAVRITLNSFEPLGREEGPVLLEFSPGGGTQAKPVVVCRYARSPEGDRALVYWAESAGGPSKVGPETMPQVQALIDQAQLSESSATEKWQPDESLAEAVLDDFSKWSGETRDTKEGKQRRIEYVAVIRPRR